MQELNSAEDRFQQEWQQTANSPLKRRLAAFSLGQLYLQTAHYDKLIAAFAPAFYTETDDLLRMVLAIHLLQASIECAQDQEPWVEALITVITGKEAFNDFFELKQFVGDCDHHEYIVMILKRANQQVLEKYLEPVIEGLGEASVIAQVSMLQTIFDLLFPDQAALEAVIPIRKKALLAIADLQDDPEQLAWNKKFFTYNDYNFPCDPNVLRLLASRG